MKPGLLTLDGGIVFSGLLPSWQTEPHFGEVVFTTGMTGYVESLTDPSYAGQILTFTFPLIGNYGVPSQEYWESEKIHAAGVVVSEACLEHSHSKATSSFVDWLAVQKVPLITGVDTRALTKILREKGVALGAISPQASRPSSFIDPNLTNLVGSVAKKEVEYFGSGNKTIIVVDCGMKANILRSLMKLPVRIKRVPYDYDYSQEEFDGVFISNGPGDPATCVAAIENLRKSLSRKKPIFGICLGAQLLALSIGAKTYKLKYGHRGQNQPVIIPGSKRCFLTSQNHGYAIDSSTLPSDWKVSFTNLNDGSVEGIEHNSLPYFAVQFHPEACPGPVDTLWLFEKFYGLL